MFTFIKAKALRELINAILFCVSEKSIVSIIIFGGIQEVYLQKQQK